MNFQKSALASAITLATFATTAAAFDASSWEVSGFVKNETAALQKDGTFIGQRTSMIDTGDKNDSGDVIKFENTAKLFVNGDLTENAALHAELNFVYDTEATPNDYQGHMNYSQNDYLRELYVDTMVGDTEVRVGKQQVVWGTADGIKLLDIINPTDYREFAQNTMEDSRIPIWMIKTDTYVGDTGSLQFIVSQAEENKIAGLNASGDQGNPYIMKGVDSITGKVNGFLNVVPALAKVANSFSAAAYGTMFGNQSQGGLSGFTGTSVDGFSSSTIENYGSYVVMPGLSTAANNSQVNYGAGGTEMAGYLLLNNIAQNGITGLTSNGNNNVTNLMDVTGSSYTDTTWNPDAATSAFEFMPNATFATFNTFSGATSRYVRDYPSDTAANAGFRFKDSTESGLNYSLNFFRHYSANPSITMSWNDATTGEELTVQRASYADEWHSANAAAGQDGNPDYVDTTSSLTVDQIPNSFGLITVLAKNSAGEYYGDYSPNPFDGVSMSSNPVEMRFTERLHRVNSFGGSFDYTVDSESLGGVVLRGEFLYDKDDKQPVVDKRLLAIGDLTNALTMQEADYFKYVLGADVTVLTNMLVSGQFIQFRNLDYVEENRSCTTQGDLMVAAGGSLTTYGANSRSFDCSKYTGDMATLHMTNGMQKAYENKEFYSLFLSKPFGPNQLGRWNNIFMFEEGGGKWNRFDVEYSFSDELVGSFELNNYWGDANTQFGQMEDSSNIQVGLKYLF
jgi:hypothetical protein